MERFTGLFGILLILGVAFLMSSNRKAINKRLVISGLVIQLVMAYFILRTEIGAKLFKGVGDFITKLLSFAEEGGAFVFGKLVDVPVMEKSFGIAGTGFIFIFHILPTIIFVSVLVSIAYHIGLMQRIVSVIARGVHWAMRVSGSEALSNVASAFVGQVEAQIMIKPYLQGMTRSELLASMSGSMACIAGGVMAVYISMGIPAEYLLAASLMAAPAALVISKIVLPETEESETKGVVKLEVKKAHVNLLEAISHGASDGLKVSLNVLAMLVGLLALIALLNWFLGLLGGFCADYLGMSNSLLQYSHATLANLSIDNILGSIFSLFAWAMGVPMSDINTAGALMGTKMVANEFVAYSQFSPMIKEGALGPKTIAIVSFALCGFANFGSIAIQVGGIGELAPTRRGDLAKLGMRALICGTLASYLSATIAGILH